jgi:Tn3 transposase DDE domain
VPIVKFWGDGLLARDVCHGKRGTVRQAYRDGMEDQLGALGLALNAIVLWTAAARSERREPGRGTGRFECRRRVQAGYAGG